VGRAIERYVQKAAEKWSTKLKDSSPPDSSKLDTEISQIVAEHQPQPGHGRIFQQTNEQMIVALRNLVWIEKAEAIAYLGPILNIFDHQKQLVIATLNYDNGVELLAASQHIPCTTGIEQWSMNGSFDFAGKGLCLLKLHGSIDWTWDRAENSSDRLMPHSIIRRVELEEVKDRYVQPAVIFGQRNKLTAAGPFLDLLRRFREELSKASKLTVVGYSFRDLHINVYISQWLNASHDHAIRIINGQNFEKSPIEYVTHLRNLRHYFPHQVEFIPLYAAQGLESIYGARAAS